MRGSAFRWARQRLIGPAALAPERPPLPAGNAARQNPRVRLPEADSPDKPAPRRTLQTIEAISHANAAGVPIVVAINKARCFFWIFFCQG